MTNISESRAAEPSIIAGNAEVRKRFALDDTQDIDDDRRG